MFPNRTVREKKNIAEITEIPKLLQHKGPWQVYENFWETLETEQTFNEHGDMCQRCTYHMFLIITYLILACVLDGICYFCAHSEYLCPYLRFFFSLPCFQTGVIYSD